MGTVTNAATSSGKGAFAATMHGGPVAESTRSTRASIGSPSTGSASLPGSRVASPPPRTTMVTCGSAPVSSGRICAREVGHDDVGAGALERDEHLVDGALLIQVAFRHRGLHHGVLTADVIDGERKLDGFANRSHHVEIRERRLDHDDIGARV